MVKVDKENARDVTSVAVDEYPNNSELKILLNNPGTTNLSSKEMPAVFRTIVEKVDADGNCFICFDNNHIVSAEIALSCLIVPAEGDVVLVNGSLDIGFFVLSVLSSKKKPSVNLNASHVNIKTDEGLSISSTSIEIDAPDFSVISKNYKVEAVAYEIGAINVDYSSEFFRKMVKHDKAVLGESEKIVTGTDRVKAFNLEYSANFYARLSGQTTVVDGYDLLKTDGKLILAG